MSFTVAVCVGFVGIQGAMFAVVIHFLMNLLMSYRLECQRLTAALISNTDSGNAAVYMSYDADKSTDELLLSAAEQRKKWLPLGLS
jgi:hypothetical protein